MAVDSRNKRMSLIGLALPVPMLLPDPDGTIASIDRLQLLACYASRTSFQTSIAAFVSDIDVSNKIMWDGFALTDSLGNIKGATVKFRE